MSLLAEAPSAPASFFSDRLPVRPRLVCAGNALKGSLGVRLAERALELGVHLGGGMVSASICLSDGGDGFLEAISESLPGRRLRAVVPDPLNRLTVAEFLYEDEQRHAGIEMALGSGIALVPENRRDIMASGTAALGDLILRALTIGARQIHIGLGGSATNDGGLGMLMRLHEALVLNRKPTTFLAAKDLASPPAIDLKAIRSRLAEVDLFVYCDVGNSLLGPHGCARVFGPQKGATAAQVELLESGMEKWADEVERQAEMKLRTFPGAGAAGGLGFALAAIGGNLLPGAQAFCELFSLQEVVAQADGLITCEGRFDKTSFHGKAPWRAAQLARSLGRHAVILCGTADPEAVAEAAQAGIVVVEFARGVGNVQRTAQAFTLLQQAVEGFVRHGR